MFHLLGSIGTKQRAATPMPDALSAYKIISVAENLGS
jgi:hypothetical protein